VRTDDYSACGLFSGKNEYQIPETMKAWVLGGPEELSLIEKPVPQPGPAEVLVRVDAWHSRQIFPFAQKEC
jgi:hypothetical protein